ncbi:MAG TPA: GNAT family N-acetyltransferase [Bryobacteraceae bacterium]|nr:GNAT family N-acetyltransferase [Bryobacteraceae bacterium]
MPVSTPLQALTEPPDAMREPPGAALARFFEARGRRVVKACGALWYSAPGHFMMSLPYQATIDPDPAEIQSMIRQVRAAGARFPSLRWNGLDSGMYVIRRRKYEFGSVHAKHRPRVRRGQQCFEIRLAEKAELLEQGHALNLSTMARQGRYDREFGDPRLWRRLVEAGFASPGVSFPAAFAGSRLAAYMVTCRDGDWLHILHQMSRQEDLPNFPNHVLTYTVTAQALADRALQAVCYGYVPLFAADGLHEYKLRFGYELIPHCSAIQLHPWLNRVLEGALAQAVLRMARRFRRNDQTLETLQTVLEGARRSKRL